jgi:hypothetical protein
VTAQHYARWIESDVYREPMRVQPDEVPADLLSRLESPKSPPTSESVADGDAPSARDHWWSQRESNPCLQGEEVTGKRRNPPK